MCIRDSAETRNVQIVTNVNNANQGLGIYAFTADSWAPRLDLGTSPNATINDFTTPSLLNSLCGQINFLGSDGDEFLPTARIEARVDGTAGNGDMPGRLVFSTTADGAASVTERMRIDSSGNVGIGTTSPGRNLHVHEGSTSPAYLQLTNSSTGSTSEDGLQILVNSTAGYIIQRENAPLTFQTNNTERARIDSSGRLLVGTSSWTGDGLFAVEGRAANGASHGLVQVARGDTNIPSGNGVGAVEFTNNAAGIGARIYAIADATWTSGSSHPTRLSFFTTADGASIPTERMRISSGGQISQFSELGWNNFSAASTTGAGTVRTFFAGFHSATAVNTGTQSFRVYTNGNVQNTNNSYTGISDIKLKENIVDASSQWDDLKAIQVRNYNFKEETGQETHTQLGVVAQEVELVSPGLVSESPDCDAEGNDLGTVTKSVNYSVLYMKAVKALQEAMERIETLEQRLNDAGIA